MTTWNEKTDVVIVGSGIAGLSAAIEATQAGASVIIIEKMKIAGGNTRISDSCLAAPGNFLQKKHGIEDSPDLFYGDMIRAGLGLNHTHLVRIVAEQAEEAIQWSRNTLGVAYLDRVDRFGGHTVARSITTRTHSGVDLIKAAVSKLKTMGIGIRTCCTLSDLITDNNGRVCGVQVRSNHDYRKKESGTIEKLLARRGVILATGGFGNDIQFRSLQNPLLNETIRSTNHKGATAEGLIAALKVNAAPVHLSWIQMGPWGCADEAGYGTGARFASYSLYPLGILVNPSTGNRIVNEWADRRERCEAILETNQPCIGIIDAMAAEKSIDTLEPCLKSGKVKKFETLAALAWEYKIPMDKLEETVHHYNRMVKNGGVDNFGKPLGDGAQPMERAPFYTIRVWPKVHYTPGGVGIDSVARVQDLYNAPIPGLFAAGEVCGGIHGASRLGSCALPECIIFGRIAGRQASKEIAIG
jgi:flavocytochrome c